jgi:hypothetical protein
MRKICMALTVALAMALCAASAMGWGSATHAYIDERINSKGPLLTLNQVYGGMAADVFNFMSDPSHPEYQIYLSTGVHCPECGNMWRVAFLPTAKALAYGFVSHNQKWAADFYAHNYSCPQNFPPTTGYIQNKAEALYNNVWFQAALVQYPELLDPNNKPFVMEVLRDVVEYAVDILLIRRDSSIGLKVSSAALLRSPEFPAMLNATYASGFSRQFGLNYFEATKIIRAAEMQFRQNMIGYGQILALGEAAAIPQISEQLAGLAEQLFGLSIDSDVIEDVIGLAMWACADDYEHAINDTVNRVRIQMGAHGIFY